VGKLPGTGRKKHRDFKIEIRENEVMAAHLNSADLSAEVIDEYIELARLGLDFQKPDGGCLGYPSTLLLFCVIDALSNHLRFEPHSLGVLNHEVFSLNLSPDQIENLKIWYRHPLAHNGMIAPGTILTPEPDGNAIELVNGEPVKIRVKPLFRLVERAWNALDKTTLMSRRSKVPKAPIVFSGKTFVVPSASSGCCIVPKVVKM